MAMKYEEILRWCRYCNQNRYFYRYVGGASGDWICSGCGCALCGVGYR